LKRLVLALAIGSCTGSAAAQAAGQSQETPSMPPTTKTATLAGGCFWCMEPPFVNLPGVISVMPGYAGGHQKHPTYEEVSAGTTGHAEAVQIVYDPSKIRYEELLEVFWRNIDPTQDDGQFADHGSQYRTAIFYHDEEQRRLAEESKQKLAASGKFRKPIVTEIVPAGEFYAAEDYHRAYYKKNPLRYQMYKAGSGREGYIKRTWGGAE
jgi:methionine-S-sulfoxide reductase